MIEFYNCNNLSKIVLRYKTGTGFIWSRLICKLSPDTLLLYTYTKGEDYMNYLDCTVSIPQLSKKKFCLVSINNCN